MENIVSISGKLLYFGHRLVKSKQINSHQLALLKGTLLFIQT
jgi:hypothetical protein